MVNARSLGCQGEPAYRTGRPVEPGLVKGERLKVEGAWRKLNARRLGCQGEPATGQAGLSNPGWSKVKFEGKKNSQPDCSYHEL